MTNEELAAYILGRMLVTDDLCEIANTVLDMCLYKVCFSIYYSKLFSIEY